MNSQETHLETERALSDSDISAAVEFLLARKQGVAPHLIDVATHEGTVMLTGHVDCLHMRERAEEIASTVRGVCDVVNSLSVCGSEVPDAALRRDVEEALLRNAVAHPSEISCTARDGKVMLLGQVRSWAEKQQVLRVAKGVRGVCDVEDRLSYPAGERHPAKSAAELTAAVEHLLAWDHRIRHALIQVTAQETGVVELRGKVGSAAERRRAIATAWLAGAARVEAKDLAVAHDASCHDLHQDKYTAKTDAAIQQAIETRLGYNPRLHADKVDVQVSGGRVTLQGLVSSLAGRRAAEHDARGVVGVRHVHNALRVRPNIHVEDPKLQQSIEEALLRDPYLKQAPVAVAVTNRRVILRGKLDSHFEKTHAEEVASNIEGIVAIENRLGILATATTDRDHYGSLIASGEAATFGSPSDADIEHRIQQQLNWSAHLHSQDVEVRVDKGVATLTGTVATELDRENAALSAYEGGATAIDNQLLTQFGPPH
ncbi:BON domain-containing protein [Hymenobacter sedentarius]|nr:BON domain-containing protein [Hymenobacter sedentarius]